MELATVRAMAEETPCLYINQEFQRGEAPVVLPPAPNAFALSQNNKEASFMDYSFSTYLMWHLNASSIASYFNSAQVCCLPLTWFYILCLVFDFSGYQTESRTSSAVKRAIVFVRTYPFLFLGLDDNFM